MLAKARPGGAWHPDHHFEVEVADGRLVLVPARVGSADAVRRKLVALGITDADVAEAVAWARTAPRQAGERD